MTRANNTNVVYPMTVEQIELARHALGFRTPGIKQSFRNHFVATPLHDDFEQWMEMVNCGNAKYEDDPKWLGENRRFWLTEAGALQALSKGESLDPEDFPKFKGKKIA